MLQCDYPNPIFGRRMVGGSTPSSMFRGSRAAFFLLTLAFVGFAGTARADIIDTVQQTTDKVFFCVVDGQGSPCPNPCGPDGINNCSPACDSQCQTVVDDVVAAAQDPVGLVTDEVNSLTDSTDHDHDGIPDAFEDQLCGRAATHDEINGHPALGNCRTTSNYTAPGIPGVGPIPPVGPYITLVENTAGDHDHDGVPDSAEPTLCSVEDQNSPSDGSCVGNNYTPPPI